MAEIGNGTTKNAFKEQELNLGNIHILLTATSNTFKILIGHNHMIGKVECFGHLCPTSNPKVLNLCPLTSNMKHRVTHQCRLKITQRLDSYLFISSALPLSMSVSFTQLSSFALKRRQRLFN